MRTMSMNTKNIIHTHTAQLSAKKNQVKTSQVAIKHKRLLTSGEIDMCRRIFKDSIDYSKVLIKRSSTWSVPGLTGNTFSPMGTINLTSSLFDQFPDFSNCQNDYSAEHHFIHEMTHIWQYQLGGGVRHIGQAAMLFRQGGYICSSISPDYGDDYTAYYTDLTGKHVDRKFHEFNLEQQGRIIELWHDAVYMQHKSPKRRHHIQSRKLLGYVERTLREFLLNPSDKKHLPQSQIVDKP
ncbi:zinc protease [Acinetobacter haemolyticus]|nr:zinc protease [Acinetobacter haemolyticus]